MKRLLTGVLIATVAVGITAAGAEAKTKPKSKPAPAACIAALDAADDMNAVTVTVLQAFGTYFGGIGAAASAAQGQGIMGGLSYIQAQTPLINTLMGVIQTNTPIASEARIRFDAAALTCRAK